MILLLMLFLVSLLIFLIVILVKRLKKPKEKYQTETNIIIGKDYVFDISLEELIKAEEFTKSDEYKDFRAEYDAKKEKQELQQKIDDVKTPLIQCLLTLNELEDVYFTYEKKMNTLKTSLELLCKFPKDDIYLTAEKEAAKLLKENFNLEIDNQMKALIENPNLFLLGINDYHKQKLMSTLEPFYDIWYERVVALKQKPAKAKRQQYVIEGYEVLRAELYSLNATKEQLNLVDSKIFKIKNENWTLI